MSNWVESIYLGRGRVSVRNEQHQIKLLDTADRISHIQASVSAAAGFTVGLEVGFP